MAAGASDETRHVLLKLCGAEGVTDARNLWENEDGRRLVSGGKKGGWSVDPFALRELRLRHFLSKQKVMNLAKGFSCKIGEVSLDVLECGQFKRIMMSFRQISWPQRLPRYTPQAPRVEWEGCALWVPHSGYFGGLSSPIGAISLMVKTRWKTSTGNPTFFKKLAAWRWCFPGTPTESYRIRPWIIEYLFFSRMARGNCCN